MVQGIMGGATPYNHQSLKEIQKDINAWKVFSKDIQVQFDEYIEMNNKLFDELPYDLKQIFAETLQTTATFIEDFSLIDQSIAKGKITDKDIRLLKNIGNISIENNSRYGKAWHGNNVDFGTYEELYNKLYCDGRDYFVTLQDASNAAERLKDYKNSAGTNIVYNNTYNANGTYIQQGVTGDATINNTFNNYDLEQINSLINKVLDNIDRYFEKEDKEDKEEAREMIEVIKDEVSKKQPKKRVLKNILHRLQTINSTSSDFTSTIVAISQILEF